MRSASEHAVPEVSSGGNHTQWVRSQALGLGQYRDPASDHLSAATKEK